MSFILDALRKSELERQRDAAARVMRIPVAQHRNGNLPAWVSALLVVLVLSVVALAGTAWRGWHKRATATPATGPTAAAPKAPAPVQPQATPPARSAATVPAGNAAARTPADTERARQAVARSDRTAPGAAPAHSEAEAAPSASTPSSPAKPPVRPSNPAVLPSVDELAAEGVQLPALNLQLHVYSKNPSQRFVFINGARYREGQRTADGPIVVSVTPKGTVLSQQGREFFLPIR